ncbi:MAG: maleylacetoacetate isomerase [Cypionkella sp.]
MPVRDIDGANLTQSLAILEYLDETRDPGLWPDAPLDRAGVRAIAADVHPVRNLRLLKNATGHSGGSISIEAGMQALIAPGLAAVEAIVTGDQHSFGSSVRLANLCLLPQLYNGHRWRVNLSDTPNLTCIGAHLQILPAFAATHPDLTPR